MALLFDFGGTLDADGVPWRVRFFRLCRDEGLVETEEQFDPVFYAADDALVGTIPVTLAFEDTVGRLAASIARGLGADDATVSDRVAARFLDDAFTTLHRNTRLLSRLRERYRMGIVSNFYGNLATVCHNAGIRRLFSVIVDSARVGWEKPDPRIFHRALSELNVAPGEALFVGDSLSRDMAGARAIGMRHVWLAGAAASRGAGCCPGDPTVRSLDELEGLLR